MNNVQINYTRHISHFSLYLCTYPLICAFWRLWTNLDIVVFAIAFLYLIACAKKPASDVDIYEQ